MILLTGAAGFIGYQISRRLQREGVRFVSVDHLSAFGTRPEHRDVQHLEMQSPESVESAAFYQKRVGTPDAITGIIHMGACSDTTEMRVDYLDRVNVNFSKSLWTRATELRIPFVYASSAATYGGGENGYEDDEVKMSQLKPLNPYGHSKLAFDLWVIEQEKSGAKTPPAWSGFKFFNVYGFGERHKTKMASVVLQGFDQIKKNKSIRLFKSHRAGIADGQQKRDFIYVEDVVDVVIYAFQHPLKRGIYNLGSGTARSFLELAQATFRALQCPEKIEFIDTPVEIRDRYQYFTQATMTKLRQAGYTRAFTSLESGVELTVKELIRHESLNS